MESVDQRADLTALVARVWHDVTNVVNKLLQTHEKYGRTRFQEEMNPSLSELVEAFKYVDTALTSLMESGLLNYDEYRDAVNSKQCILKMKLLSMALESEAHDDYERIIAELQGQAQF